MQSCETTLPADIAVEILLRLPVESLLRCKSVCKAWCSLISDPRFIKSHLILSTQNNHFAHHKLIYSTKIGYSRPIIKLKTCHLHDVLHDNSINNALELDYPLKHALNHVWVVGCCNGLLCMAVGKDVLYIWNPSTRKSYSLPASGYGYKKQLGWYGFGYQQSTDDYKVVEVSREVKDRETLVRVYSLKNGNWKTIGAFPHGFRFYDYGKFCNGALHWGAYKDLGSWIILSLDLENETYGEVLQPVYDEGDDDDDDKDLRLGSLREWLCVLCNYQGIRADLWVMKVYGVKDSWTKLVSIPYLTYPGWDRFSVPLCISNDGKFLLQFGWRKLIVYDSKNGSFSEIQNADEYIKAFVVVESLVSPMPVKKFWR